MRFTVWIVVLCSIVLADVDVKSLYLQSKTKDYHAITPAEFRKAVNVFESLFRFSAKDLGSQQRSLECLGLEMKAASEGILVIVDTRSQGGGFYLIRQDEKGLPMISVPHRFHDLKTGKIGLALMDKGDFKAAAFNTVHRKTMDAAHTEWTFFNAFHLAFARTYPQSSIYQLHGFSKGKRASVSAQKANMIISSGSVYPSQKAEDCFECIGKLLPTSRLFGKDIFELGGTKNTQYRSLAGSGYDGFVHIEMEKKLRDALADDPQMRSRIGRCLR